MTSDVFELHEKMQREDWAVKIVEGLQIYATNEVMLER